METKRPSSPIHRSTRLGATDSKSPVGLGTRFLSVVGWDGMYVRALQLCTCALHLDCTSTAPRQNPNSVSGLFFLSVRRGAWPQPPLGPLISRTPPRRWSSGRPVWLPQQSHSVATQNISPGNFRKSICPPQKSILPRANQTHFDDRPLYVWMEFALPLAQCVCGIFWFEETFD